MSGSAEAPAHRVDPSMAAPARARRYQRWRFWLGAANLLLGTAYLMAWIATGATFILRDRLTEMTREWWVALPAALLVLVIGHRLLALPLDWLGGFWIPRRFGLLHQPFHRWLLDRAKGSLIGGGLGVAVALALYGLLRVTPWWWLCGALLLLAGSALLALATPLVLLPLFYRLVPLPDAELRERLLRVAERAGVPVLGVWVADQSRRSRTANAAVIGLWRTRRIVLFDTLVKEFTADEVEAVLAHEVAHHVHGDVGRGLLFQAAVTLASFWVADVVLGAAAHRLGLAGLADLAGLPVLGLVLAGTGLVAMPLVNGWSRHVERQADDFALRATGRPEAFISAMTRLAALNLAEIDPHPVKEFLLHSHPSIGRRIAMARRLIRQPRGQ